MVAMSLWRQLAKMYFATGAIGRVTRKIEAEIRLFPGFKLVATVHCDHVKCWRISNQTLLGRNMDNLVRLQTSTLSLALKIGNA
jgi:hypothetical protein